MRTILSAALLGCLTSSHHGYAAEPLVIHEWGTFTSLQDEQGRTIGGINTDEEVLPEFVHDLSPVLMGKDGDFAPRLIKGRDYCDPSVTMRLETPVIYVHLPPGQQQAGFDLSVEFRGGILSQFYPLADATVDRQPLRQDGGEIFVGEVFRHPSGRQQVRFSQPWSAPELTSATTSSLTWRGIAVGGNGTAQVTTSPVWLAPRQVDAANLSVGAERERYLFYRGLGHLDAPLVARRSTDGAQLAVCPRAGALEPSTVPRLWFADLRGDGTAAFRTIDSITWHIESADNPATSVFPATFAADDYSRARLEALRHELHAALMQEGLFADEATALLTTWEASYFKAAGQRLFFLVPSDWTEHTLPLTISVPATVKRALMGRIEVVSPGQRQALQRIADGPVSDGKWFEQFVHDHIRYFVGNQVVYRPGGEELDRRMFVENERGLLAKLNIVPPPDYQAYLALGRFRDALLWDAQVHSPDPERVAFLRTYQLVWAPMGWRWDALQAKPLTKPVANLNAP
jgi:hypothetical protein